MTYTIVRTKQEIDSVRDRVEEDIAEGNNPYFGMTYAEGIRDMLWWLTDEDADDPYPEQ